MIINAENTILGRLSTYAAKQALLGEKVEIVNCEKAVMTGTRENVFLKYKNKQSPGDVNKKPKVYKMPDMLVRRTIRGMLPWKRDRGREAYKRIFCYIGLPESLKDKQIVNLDNANISKLKNLKYVYIKEISKYLGNTR
ncbi:MAG: 50S ribosomal protein L13 [Nanoarchaeota archaeon]